MNNTDIVEFYKQETLPELFKVSGEGNRVLITLGDGSKIRFAPTQYKLYIVENGSDSKVIPNHKKHIGEFFLENYALDNPEDGFFTEGRWLPVAILDPTRVMFAGRYEAGVKADPICKSNDGITPSKSIMVPQAPTCAECENSKWTKGETKSEPPKCGETIHVVFFDVDRKVFFTYGFASTRISPWNKLIKNVNKVLDTAYIRGLDLSSYVIIAKVEDKSTYNNFNFEYAPVKDLNTEIYKPLIVWYIDNIVPAIKKERMAYEESIVGSGGVGNSGGRSGTIDEQVLKGFEDVGLGDKEELSEIQL